MKERERESDLGEREGGSERKREKVNGGERERDR